MATDHKTEVADESDSGGDDPTSEVVTPASTETLIAAEAIARLGFVIPTLSEDLTQQLEVTYGYVDPRGEVPRSLLLRALAYYQTNSAKLGNKRYLSVVDFSAHSSKARLFIVNMTTGAVWSLHVAHGKGSDRDNDGLAERFSNQEGTEASSLGYYLTAETYSGQHGSSMRLDGLSPTNSNIRKRAIVFHGATYVYDRDVQAGRSWGCLAVSMANRQKAISLLKGGSLIFAERSAGQ